MLGESIQRFDFLWLTCAKKFKANEEVIDYHRSAVAGGMQLVRFGRPDFKETKGRDRQLDG